MADNRSIGTRKDPLPVFCFLVKIDIAGFGDGEAFFKSVSGIRYETETYPVKEGGANDTTFMLPGATKWSNLVFKQGFTGSSALLDWREMWMTNDPKNMKRSKGTITQLNTARQSMASWSFVGAWPCKWEMAEFDASKSELAIETLELAIEGIKWNASKAAGK